jgi:hypothetical protein
VAILLYGIGVSRLGAAGGSAFVALVPALAALIAIPVLGEWPDAAGTIGVALATVDRWVRVATLRNHRRTGMMPRLSHLIKNIRAAEWRCAEAAICDGSSAHRELEAR